MGECYTQVGEDALAEYYFQRALEIEPNDPITLFRYACFLDQFHRYNEAEDHYLHSLEISPNNSHSLCCYSDFLWKIKKNLDAAEMLYECSLMADPNHTFSLNNYACFCFAARKNYQKAEDLFLKLWSIYSSTGDSTHNSAKLQHVKNISSFIKLAGKTETEQTLLKISQELQTRNKDASINFVSIAPPKPSKSQRRNMRRKKTKQKKRDERAAIEGAGEMQSDSEGEGFEFFLK